MSAMLICPLCVLTCSACFVMLFAEFRRTERRVLGWTSGCFFFLGLNNLILFVDVVLLPEIDLSAWRLVAAVLGYAILIWGFVWDIP